MNDKRIQFFLGVAASVTGLAQAAQAQFNTLEKWGNAAGTTPPAAFSQSAGIITITAGGEGFEGTSDHGAFLWSNTGAMTTKGDFTAIARHVGTTTPAPEWGRDGIMVRATQTAGTLSANDAYWMTTRKSNGGLIINRRPAPGAQTWRATDIGNAAVNFDSNDNDQALATGDVRTTPVFLAAGRSGNRLHSGFAMDLGGGVTGRWVEKWSTAAPAAVSALQGSAEVVVGLAHQSHTGSIVPDTNDINTATFDNWSYSDTFNANRFGPAAASTGWQVAGTVQGDPATGQVLGSAFVRENGKATGEPVKWSLGVYPRSAFVPKFNLPGSRKDATAMPQHLLVSKNHFRQGGPGSPAGLTAQIYLCPTERSKAANAGILSRNLALMSTPGVTKTSAVIPQVYWNTGAYPQDDNGNNIFAKAFNDTGYFLQQEDNYGVEMTGQIFIPADSDRARLNLPGEFILFKDGVGDFAYLEIDGLPLINDNSWTGVNSRDNGGGNLAVFDVSNPKYNDGEWVPFRMIMWEGAGGDSAALYWSVDDGKNGAEPVFTADSVPGGFGTLKPMAGVANSRKDPNPAQEEDLIPAQNFRHAVNGGGTMPGLKADIYLGVNPGTIAGVNRVTSGAPASSAILSNIFWKSSAGQVNYPSNGAGSNVFAAAGAAKESNDEYGYSNYGVNLTGEIFIPGKAQRTALPVAGGDKLVLFKDGVGDFAYLEVDGQVLISDNEWTSIDAVDNGGGQVSLMDVSDPKFDNGAWVAFRMVTWEGTGSDSAALYWSALDANGSFGIPTIPGIINPGTDTPVQQAAGVSQVGTHTENGRFGDITLPVGDWLAALEVANTGTSVQRLAAVTIQAPEVRTFTFDPGTNLVNLSFTSYEGARYALEYTIGFQSAGTPAGGLDWAVVPSHASITGQAGLTAIAPLNVSTLVEPVGQLKDARKCFFRIRRL